MNQAVQPRMFVDGNNVMGSRPDGWWRDRAGPREESSPRSPCLCATVRGYGRSCSMGRGRVARNRRRSTLP